MTSRSAHRTATPSTSAAARRALRSMLALAVAGAIALPSVTSSAALPHMHGSHAFTSGVLAQAKKKEKEAAPAAEAPAPVHFTEKQLNDFAKFMAGLPVDADSSVAEKEKTTNWVTFSKTIDKNYKDLEAARLSKIRTWAETNMGEAYTKKVPLYYTFSGPDYLYASQFFPNASLYILAGLEPVGSVPNIEALSNQQISAALSGLTNTLVDSLGISFFVTKNMSGDLRRSAFQGTIPVIMVFMARNGATIHSIKHIGLDENGAIREIAPNTKGFVPGVEFVFTSKTGQKQKLVYFSGDIQNNAIKKNPAFLKYMAAQEAGNGFYKAASYLLHGSMFSYVKHMVMNKSHTVVQDDSGVPVREYKPEFWDVNVFGNYVGPISLFSGNFQKEIAGVVKAQGGPKPMGFGLGYRHRANESAVILAVKKKDAPLELPGTTTPEAAPKPAADTSKPTTSVPAPAPAPTAAAEEKDKTAAQDSFVATATVTPAPGEAVLVITIQDDGSAVIKGKEMNKEEITAEVEKVVKANPEGAIVLKADKAAPYAHVTYVLEICTAAGATKVAFAFAEDSATAAKADKKD
ncbi:hypothetical protein DB346_12510 [Verrucomicrobia bacterium LW23]|nr:hypothetical protein DB346_12510 [Verrucomicrobia bacterium LW23]